MMVFRQRNFLCRIGCTVIVLLSCFPVLADAQPTPNVSATAVPSVAPQGEAANAILGQFAAAWARVTGYTATATVFDRKDAQVQNFMLEYTFQQPSNVTARVDAGSNAGVTMVWTGGTTVVAHRGSGFAALFKKTLSLHDPQVTTLRGSSIDQLSFGAILAHAQQEAGRLTQTAQADIGGVSIDALTLVPANPAANAGLTREVVELSASTHLPVQVLGYEGTTLVRQIDFSKVVLKQ